MRRRMWLITLLAVLVGRLNAPVCHAQDLSVPVGGGVNAKSPQTTSAVKSQVETARELLNLTVSDEAFNALTDQIVSLVSQYWWDTAGQQSKASMAAAGVQISAEDEARVKAVMTRVTRRVWQETFPKSELLGALSPIYAQFLTTDEMNEIIRFYRTPAGTKAVAMTGKMMIEVQKQAQSLLAGKSAAFTERVKTELMAEVQRETAGETLPVLRQPKEGEERVFGTLDRITCGTDGIFFNIKTGSRTLRVTAQAFDKVDFVSWRDDVKGSFGCQMHTPIERVYATWRPRPAAKGDGVDGVLLAMEFVR